MEFRCGTLRAWPQTLQMDVVFPGPPNRFSIGVENSFDTPINMTSFAQNGNSSDIIKVVRYQSQILPGKNLDFLEFVIDPALLRAPSEHFLFQKQRSPDKICLHDIERWYDTSDAWIKIKQRAGEINAVITINTSYNLKLTVEIKGTIRPPVFFPNSLGLGATLLGASSENDLVVSNPFDAPMSIQLYLSPLDFFDL